MESIEDRHFMTPEEIANELLIGYQRREKKFKENPDSVFVSSKVFLDNLLETWVKVNSDDTRTIPHTHKISDALDCCDLTDEWWKTFLTNPFDSSPLYAQPQLGFTDPFLFNRFESKNVAKAYMIGISGFKSPDIRRIVIAEKLPILIPVYNMSAAAEEQLWDSNRQAVSVDENEISRTLTEIVVDDLCGLYQIEAKFDNMPITGCTVLRTNSYLVPNIPNNNVRAVPSDRLGQGKSMRVCHGGFYILLNPENEAMRRGEHLLYFKAFSVNYEVEAKVHIGIIAS
jgi:hypothetical protein